MPTLTEWPLPLNPPNPYPFYLQFLTPERRNRLQYTKYIVDVVGELTLTSGASPNVREWPIPAALKGGAAPANPLGIAHGPRETVWCALQSAHLLLELDTASGLMTAYGVPKAQYPIRYPSSVTLDRRANVWYTGMGSDGALVGFLDRSRKFARFWDLPIEMLTPYYGLWVALNGKDVWLAPINPNIYLTGAFLAHLDTRVNDLTMWHHVPPWRPVNAGVAADHPTQPRNIWFTCATNWGNGLVYRFELSTGVFYRYSAATYTVPRGIQLDANGDAWIGHWVDRVSTIRAGANCGVEKFTQTTVPVDPVDMPVNALERRVKPQQTTVVPTSQPSLATTDACYVHYSLPSLYATAGSLTLGPGTPPPVYFAESGVNRIGRLVP